jgi:hypothetical protein
MWTFPFFSKLMVPRLTEKLAYLNRGRETPAAMIQFNSAYSYWSTPSRRPGTIWNFWRKCFLFRTFEPSLEWDFSTDNKSYGGIYHMVRLCWNLGVLSLFRSSVKPIHSVKSWLILCHDPPAWISCTTCQVASRHVSGSLSNALPYLCSLWVETCACMSSQTNIVSQDPTQANLGN